MKNPVPASSLNISQFGFKAVFDLFLENLSLDVADLTIFHPGGIDRITAITFSVIDPTGYTYPLEAVDLDTLAPVIIPIGSNFNFGAFTITGTISDQTGIVSSITLSKNICQPKEWYLGKIKGLFTLDADCTIPKITVSDKTDYAYLGNQPESMVKQGKLFYPNAVLTPMDFSFSPFSIGESDGIYTGEYRIQNTTMASYDLEDNVFLTIPYQTDIKFQVSCQSSLTDILTCVADLQQVYVLNGCNIKGAAAKDLLDSISIDLIMALLKAQSGKDNRLELEKIKKALNCCCGCSESGFIESGIISSGESFAITSGDGVAVSKMMSGDTTQFKLSSNIDIQPTAGDTSFKVTKSVADGLVLFEVEIDYTYINAIFENRFLGLEASISINAGQIALKASQVSVDSLTGRMVNAEASIVVNANAITLKASQTSVDTLTGRIDTAEASIIVNASAITLKASQTSLDTLTGRVTSAEASIVINANAITLKASQSAVDDLNGRLVTAEASIVVNANAITLKASQISVNTLTGRVDTAEASIIVNANQVALKASQSSLDTLTGRVTSAESSIIVNANAITLKASQSAVDGINGRLVTAEASIIVNANAITLKASQSALNTLTGRVDTAEASIIVNANAITLKASQSSLNTLSGRVDTAEASIIVNANAIALKATQSSVDSLTGRINTAEASIIVNANSITSKVSTTDFTGNTIVSMINQLPDTIKISAKNLSLDGSVTFSYLDSELITINKIVNGAPDREFTFRYPTGQKAIVIGLDETGDPTIRGYLIDGTEKWRIDTISNLGIQYVTVIPEAWRAEPLALMTTDMAATQTQLRSIIEGSQSICWKQFGADYYVGVDRTIMAYYYSPGQNPEAAGNAQYEGFKTANNDKITNIADGWYVNADRYFGLQGMEQNNPVYAQKIVGGKIESGLYLENLVLDGNQQCSFTGSP